MRLKDDDVHWRRLGCCLGVLSMLLVVKVIVQLWLMVTR